MTTVELPVDVNTDGDRLEALAAQATGYEARYVHVLLDDLPYTYTYHHTSTMHFLSHLLYTFIPTIHSSRQVLDNSSLQN